MNIEEFLEDLRNKNIEFRLEGDRLICNYSEGFMNPEVLAEIKKKKPEIISFLKEASNSRNSPIVAIQPYGDRPPFFCFHGVGGNVLNYRVLTTFLPRNQPLYGLQSCGLDGKTPPFRNIKSMATYYLSAIKKLQPSGPYFFGGGSMGGAIAIETAKQLQQMGDIIGLLVMFDTIGPNLRVPHYNGFSRIDELLRLMKTKGLTACYSHTLARVANKIDHHKKLSRCERLLKQNKVIPHELRFWYIEQINLKALRRYRINSYNGEIVLIKAANEREGIYSDPERGWHGIANKGLRIIELAGRHASFVEEPLLCEQLAKCLHEEQMEKKILNSDFRALRS
jgi:thioesterase domain-containing protein